MYSGSEPVADLRGNEHCPSPFPTPNPSPKNSDSASTIVEKSEG